jgi:hypothetical protein
VLQPRQPLALHPLLTPRTLPQNRRRRLQDVFERLRGHDCGERWARSGRVAAMGGLVWQRVTGLHGARTAHDETRTYVRTHASRERILAVSVAFRRSLLNMKTASATTLLCKSTELFPTTSFCNRGYSITAAHMWNQQIGLGLAAERQP